MFSMWEAGEYEVEVTIMEGKEELWGHPSCFEVEEDFNGALVFNPRCVSIGTQLNDLSLHVGRIEHSMLPRARLYTPLLETT
eukprot:753419-Hanusia_phi.AAC.1